MSLKVILLTACLSFATSSAKPAIEEFIINGTAIDPKEHKHLVLVYMNGVGMCTGSILSDSWVITAAHCFDDKFVSSDIYHYHGSLHSRKHHKIATVMYKDVVLNPGYRKQPYKNTMDMALMRTKEKIHLNKNIQPIALATTAPRAGQPAVIAGFGVTHEENFKQTPTCELPLPFTGPVNIIKCNEGKGILCTSGLARTYHGDSGGPLVSNGKLVGTVIGLSDSKLHIYLSVPANLKWIKKVLSN